MRNPWLSLPEELRLKILHHADALTQYLNLRDYRRSEFVKLDQIDWESDTEVFSDNYGADLELHLDESLDQSFDLKAIWISVFELYWYDDLWSLPLKSLDDLPNVWNGLVSSPQNGCSAQPNLYDEKKRAFFVKICERFPELWTGIFRTASSRSDDSSPLIASTCQATSSVGATVGSDLDSIIVSPRLSDKADKADQAKNVYDLFEESDLYSSYFYSENERFDELSPVLQWVLKYEAKRLIHIPMRLMWVDLLEEHIKLWPIALARLAICYNHVSSLACGV
jgi:hypothetical protein